MSEQIFSAEIAKHIRNLFTVGEDGVVLVYTGTANYVPSPLQNQLKRIRNGNRAVYVSIEFPQLPEVLSGLAGPIDGMGNQNYTFDVALLHKIGDKAREDIPLLQQGMANFLMGKLAAWCDGLKTTPVSGDKWQLHAAEIQGGTFNTAPDLHRLGWWAVSIRVGVIVTVNRR